MSTPSSSEPLLNSLSDSCSLCFLPLDRNDPDTWKGVFGFVGGPKKDSMRLRRDNGEYAHGPCVLLMSAGQSIDQLSIFEERSSDSGTDNSDEYPTVFSD